MPALPIGARLSDSVVRVEKSRSTLTKAFDPNEPRDDHGRWVRGLSNASLDFHISSLREERDKHADVKPELARIADTRLGTAEAERDRRKKESHASEAGDMLQRLEDARAATLTAAEEYEARRKRELRGREMTPYERMDFLNRLKTFQDQLNHYDREALRLKAQRRERS